MRFVTFLLINAEKKKKHSLDFLEFDAIFIAFSSWSSQLSTHKKNTCVNGNPTDAIFGADPFFS